MFARLKLATISFIAVFMAYSLYVWTVVPLIDPPVKRRVVATNAELNPAEKQSRRQHLTQIASLFPNGAWELDEPKMVETDQGLFLFRDYKPQADGRMELKPCTLIFYSSGNRRVGGQYTGRPIVMSAPGGAMLQFEGSSDTLKAEFGKLRGGRLPGEIRIFSPESQPGAGDPLEITTRDIRIDEQKISTLHEVDFRFGDSFGSGRDLAIMLAPPQSTGRAKQPLGPAIGGIKTMELVQIDKFHLQTRPRRIAAKVNTDGVDHGTHSPNHEAPSAEEHAPASTATKALFQGGETTLEVTCRGSFFFDFDEPSASFEDHVDVVRLSPHGPSDQLNCQLLTVYFVKRSEPVRGKDPANDRRESTTKTQNNSSIERVVAEGQPAILRAPSVGASARADYLEYNLQTRRVRLGSPPSSSMNPTRTTTKQIAFLQHGPNQVEGPRIEYEIPEDQGRLGRVWVEGPGQLRGFVGKEDPLALETSWKGKLYVRPYEGNQVISLTGGAFINYANQSRFAAEELHIWLYEVPKESRYESQDVAIDKPKQQRFMLVPDRLLALGKVKLDSPRFSGSIDRAEAWFDNDPRGSMHGDTANNNPQIKQATSTNTKNDSQFVSTGASPQKFDISGKVVKMQLRRAGTQTVMDDAAVEGGVELSDAASMAAGLMPQLKISGESLHLLDASSGRATIRVNGRADKPALVSARGTTMSGAAIKLNQAENRVWIEGAGRMTLPMPVQKAKPAGQMLYQNERTVAAAPAPEPLVVDWQGGMIFDGTTARFQQNVAARGKQWTTQGERVELLSQGATLDVVLNQHIDFTSPPQESSVGLQRLIYGGSVLFTTRTFKDNSQIAFEQMQLNNLIVEQSPNSPQPNLIRGEGPGWLSSVRFGNDMASTTTLPLSGRPATSQNATSQNGSAQKKSQLNYLFVQFARSLEGNVQTKNIVFSDQVKTAYGPVKSWEEQLRPDPQYLGEDGVLLTCDKLSIAEMPGYLPNQRALELNATGNAYVEGRQFAARGGRMSYAQAKELIILEGDVRADAELWKLPRSNQVKPDAIARKIMFWKRDNRVEVDGARYVDLSRFSNANSGR